ncbi:hypothetical protein [Pectobacterium cacticida]|uniref:hypothetical protein n=1 Tax=Pectobacterium cacticida TaxID=69221 RepID=UPI002FF06151
MKKTLIALAAVLAMSSNAFAVDGVSSSSVGGAAGSAGAGAAAGSTALVAVGVAAAVAVGVAVAVAENDDNGSAGTTTVTGTR